MHDDAPGRPIKIISPRCVVFKIAAIISDGQIFAGEYQENILEGNAFVAEGNMLVNSAERKLWYWPGN